MTVSSAPVVTPLSSRSRLRRLDKRTRESRWLAARVAELTEHCGGADRITPTQRLLIERVSADLLRLRMYDDLIMAGEELSIHQGRIIGALRNSTRLGLRELGLKAGANAADTAMAATFAALRSTGSTAK
jgi:hypothetical protein